MKLQAVAEDLRRLGLALIIAAVVGGFFQETIPAGITYSGLIIGAASWLLGIALTGETS